MVDVVDCRRTHMPQVLRLFPFAFSDPPPRRLQPLRKHRLCGVPQSFDVRARGFSISNKLTKSCALVGGELRNINALNRFHPKTVPSPRKLPMTEYMALMARILLAMGSWRSLSSPTERVHRTGLLRSHDLRIAVI